MSPAQRAVPRRERARAATIEEIKQTALTLMREQGSADVRFTDIARAMEMTPPAMYRYFADREDLLNALIADAYENLGRSVAQARAQVPAGHLADAFVAAGQAYRDWAHREPEQFALMRGLPKFEPDPTPSRTTANEAAGRAMTQLYAIFAEARQRGVLRPPLIREVHPAVAACALAKNAHIGTDLPPETFQAMLHAWASLHGFITLEANGHFTWMDELARDQLFHGQLRLAAETAGLPTGD